MRSILTSIVLLALLSTTAFAQEVRDIRRGQSIPGTLASDAKHRFAVSLDEDTFVFGEVDQLSVDVVVTVLDPDGDEVRRFDSPARGPEKFTFESEAEGRYIIEVTPFEEAEGDYVLEILRTERVASDPEDRVDQLLMPFSDGDTPGAVVGVVVDGSLRFSRAYGMANLSHGIAFETGTISNIGSVTKQFTAMGLLLLQAEGRLSLEDDIREHIPELPDFGTPISLRNLLNHTGGYREIYHLMPMTGYQDEDAFSRDKVIQIVQRQPELQALPNTEFNYNNTGYILLATTIERVTEMTFPAYMKTKIFTPLGMTDTRVKGYQGEIIPGSAQGYLNAEAGGYRTARDLAASYGAGGIYTTVEDLSRWMMNYRDQTLGGPDAIGAITTNTILNSGDSTGYGLGMGLGALRGRTLYQHTGGDTAHRAYFGYFPELESGVIILSNNGSFNLGVARQIALAFFEDRFDPEEVEEESVETAEGMSEERLAAIAGDWRIVAPSLDIVYSVEKGELYAQATGQRRFKVVPNSDSTAAFQGVPATVTFHFEEDGTVNRATHHQGPSVPMKRVEKIELTADDLAAFVGRYYSEEVETLFEMTVEDGKLVAHNIRMDPLTLTPRDVDEFSSSAFFFKTIAFQRSGNGQITGFMGSNGRTKNVWFRRQ